MEFIPLSYQFSQNSTPQMDPINTNQLKENFMSTIQLEKIGFFQLTNLNSDLSSIKKIQAKISSFSHLVHIGLGGSVLGPKALTDSLLSSERIPNKKITYIDNLDPEDFYETLHSLKLEETLFYIVSKSGETLETKAMLHALMIFLQNTFSTRESLEKYMNRHFIFCTDPAKGLLRSFCHQHNSIDTLDLPPSLGGRFSVISSVGLVPLAFLHIDGMGAVEKFISSALNERDEIKNSLTSKNAVHPLITLAAMIHEQMTKSGKNETVFMPYVGRLKTLSLWFAQLWGESLGKIHPTQGPAGLTPLSAIGPSDQHSLLQLIAQGPKNKFIIFLNQKNTPSPQLREVLINSPLWNQTQNFSLQDVRDACLWGTQQSLQEVDVPSCVLEFEKLNVETMAKLFLQLECLTVLVSLLMEIDAFDQPGVERGKILAKEFLARRQK
ncbi:MAG: hypothetical protein QE271_09095 [Bacteriovoracaceae bacterium]|nr:hypothetical protein [Bacteriovoracaceae bacterium]